MSDFGSEEEFSPSDEDEKSQQTLYSKREKVKFSS